MREPPRAVPRVAVLAACLFIRGVPAPGAETPSWTVWPGQPLPADMRSICEAVYRSVVQAAAGDGAALEGLVSPGLLEAWRQAAADENDADLGLAEMARDYLEDWGYSPVPGTSRNRGEEMLLVPSGHDQGPPGMQLAAVVFLYTGSPDYDAPVPAAPGDVTDPDASVPELPWRTFHWLRFLVPGHAGDRWLFDGSGWMVKPEDFLFPPATWEDRAAFRAEAGFPPLARADLPQRGPEGADETEEWLHGD